MNLHSESAAVRSEGDLRYLHFHLITNFEEEDLIDRAAFMLDYVARISHPFVDGNKRAALGLAVVFLGVNGWELRFTRQISEPFMLEVADGKKDMNAIKKWLELYMRKK